MPRPTPLALILVLAGGCLAAPPALVTAAGPGSGRPPAATAAAAEAPAAPAAAVADLIQAGRYADAEAAGRRLLAATEAAATPDSLAVADVLDALGESLWRGGKASDPQAQALVRRAIRIRERQQGPQAAELATSLNNLANMCRLTADYAQARSLFERALAIRETTLGPEHARTAGSANNLANVLVDLGELEAAGEMYQRAERIFEQTVGADHPYVAQCLGNLAIVRRSLGDYAEAKQLNERALAIRETTLGPDHPLVAQTLNNLGHLLMNIGDYAQARAVFERTIAILETALGPEHPDVGNGLNNLASTLEEMGDYAAARPLHERALAVRRKSLGTDHPDYAQGLVNLAIVEWKTGNAAVAASMCERAVAVAEKALGPDHAQVGRMLAELAQMRWDAGDSAGALEASRRAVTILERSLGAEHPDVAHALCNFAVVLRETGQHAAALPLLERALALARASLGPAHPTVARCARELALVQWARGDGAAALANAVAAEEAGRTHLRLTTRGLTEGQALRFAAAREGGLDLALALAGGGLPLDERRRVWDAQVRSRALVLDEMAARHRGALASGDAAADSLRAGFERARTRLANLSVRGIAGMEPARYRALLEAAAQQAQAAEHALARHSAVFAAEQARQDIGLDAVLAALPDGAALVAYSRSTPASAPGTFGADAAAADYLAFVTRGRHQAVEVVRLGTCAQIDAAIASWQREASRVLWRTDIAAAEAAYFDAGDELRRRVWDPLATRVSGASCVFIVPDGALHLVNFAALPVQPGRYLVETNLLHLLSAERDLVEDAAADNRGLLVVGDPDFEHAGPSRISALLGNVALFRGTLSACAALQDVHFDRLPGTRREAQAVSSLYRHEREPVVQLQGGDADEATVKRQMPGKRIVHLATHGFLLGGACDAALAAGLPAARAGRAGDHSALAPLPRGTGENPLLLSGLALAGANRRGDTAPDAEDGVLTAEEVAALDLRGVQWAVLSACETAAGDVLAGEGVLGLRRAFQTAGAGTLIMSLWPVEDEAARAFMTELYRARLKDDLDTGRAVRQASLRVLQRQRARGRTTHPSVWAGFIAAGGWR